MKKIRYKGAFRIIMGISLLLMLFSCERDIINSGKPLTCSVERTNDEGTLLMAENDLPAYFKGGNNRTDEEAHSGHYSVMTIPKLAPYSLEYTIDNIEPDAYLQMSVWRKSKDGSGLLVAAIEPTKYYYKVEKIAKESDNNGWEKLTMEINIPPHIPSNSKLKLYVWNNGKDTVYFDDLTIRMVKERNYPVYHVEPLSLVFDTSEYLKLYDKRKLAFEAGILQAGDDDWVKGIIFGEGKAMKAKVRLKGDWLDHLYGNKWSYRIKMKKNYSWNRLRTFSLQTPAARDFLMEYVAHLLYRSKDVLTTRYGFVPLLINGRSRGLYAWEEHMVKQLVESSNRREGPIIKFSEDPFWQIQKMNIKMHSWPAFPYYETARIEPFNSSKTMESSSLRKEYLQAQKLMQQYRLGERKPDDIFDLDKLSMYFAMLDLTQARHGMAWHNQRYYYNPVIQKLEPIAFDGYVTDPTIKTGIEANFAWNLFYGDEYRVDQNLFQYIFTDSLFLAKYMMALEEISESRYIDSMYSIISPDADYYDSLLKMEYPYYRYGPRWFTESAANIRSYLPVLKTDLDKLMKQGMPGRTTDVVFTDSTVFEDTPRFFVNAFTEGDSTTGKKISVHNFFPQQIKLLGTASSGEYITHFFNDQKTLLPYHSGMVGETTNISVDTTAELLFFKLLNDDEVFQVQIVPWPFPTGGTIRQELFASRSVTHPLVDHISGKKLFLKQGIHQTAEPLIIPSGYEVIVQQGTTIDMIRGAYFLTLSPVDIRGVVDDSVVFTSSDRSARGVTVLQAKTTSKVRFTRFNNLDTFNEGDWQLTGAVTFYESPVDMDGVVFSNNLCEDALNTVRTKFKITHALFDNTWGDAYDADFCTGIISNSVFTNPGNDGIDYSGSYITVANTKIDHAQDKGISGGEDSHLTIKEVDITRCNIGIASKDLSDLKIEDARIDSCTYGIVLLQKKPEYGPARMSFINSAIKDSEVQMLIEKGSVVTWDGLVIEGKEKNVARLFY